MIESRYILQMDSEGGIVLPEELLKEFFVCESQANYIGFHNVTDEETEIILFQDLTTAEND